MLFVEDDAALRMTLGDPLAEGGILVSRDGSANSHQLPLPRRPDWGSSDNLLESPGAYGVKM